MVRVIVKCSPSGVFSRAEGNIGGHFSRSIGDMGTMGRGGKGGADLVDIDESESTEIDSSKIDGLDMFIACERSKELDESTSRSP